MEAIYRLRANEIDNEFIEAVFIHKPKRKTICISSQVGCALGCRFCATGSMGFNRNLTPGETVCQLLTVSADIGETITNIVVMGMGEPFLNYEQVIKALDILSDILQQDDDFPFIDFSKDS